jgi:anhydro-N-acetylmuramic acid kinase
MSGTSLDGIDAALIEINGTRDDVSWTLLAFRESPYDARRREIIHDAIADGSAASICDAHAQMGEWLAQAAADLAHQAGLPLESVDVIGSHGQTIWHVPPSEGKRGATLQIGCAATIAERTGCPVVSDFRSRDVAANGHGAPLVPWADHLLFAHPDHARVLVNVGGMANLTWVPKRGSGDDVVAFDTGPGNVLIDAAMHMATDGAQSYDDSGAIAAAGTVDRALLDELAAHPFFDIAPPRSTGRELFGRGFVADLVARDRTVDAKARALSLIPTLTELTASTIADAMRRWLGGREIGEVLVTGGGARNRTMMNRLAALMAPVPVLSGADAGIQPDAKEAIVFAALAWAHVQGIPGNLPAATGAAGPRVLGSYTPGLNR